MTEEQVLQAHKVQGATLLETLLAQAFVRKYPGRYEEYVFNFRLGAGTDPGPTFTPYIRKMNILLTNKRVDLVTRKDNHFALWEIKARAGFNSLGQLLGYAALWRFEKRPSVGLELGLITRLVDADADVALKAHSIQVEVFDTPQILAAAINSSSG